MKINAIYIIILIGCTAFSPSVHAQESATAVMKASVRIVQSSGIDYEAIPSLQITEANRNGFSVGYLTIEGMNGAAIYFSDNVVASDKKGNKVRFGVHTETTAMEKQEFRILGRLTDHLPPYGIYHGTLAVRIEHL